MTSPYLNVPMAQWAIVTAHLVNQHPLTLNEIEQVAVHSWGILWNTRVGDVHHGYRLADADPTPPAQVIGYFFEMIFAQQLKIMSNNNWSWGRGSQKDLVYVPDDSYSLEMKSSGQLGTKVYGNRSYGQVGQGATKKDKSGYYITINFHQQTLMLIRFDPCRESRTLSYGIIKQPSACNSEMLGLD
jgi:hypothetical protein